jgi:hypothetical protein
MSWARIDDGFDDHPKVVALLDEDDTSAAAAAVALWTLCLTWAHRNTRRRGKTPGLLPAGLPRRFLGGLGKDGAQLLVKHRLWEPQDDGGWIIHDFDEYLPTEETREARSAAGKLGAAKRWEAQRAAEAAQAELADGKLPSDCHDPDSNAVANDGSRAPARRVISKEITPVPTPVPEELFPLSADEAAKLKRVDPPDRFDEFYKIYPRKKNPADARKAWRAAIKTTPADVIIAGAVRYAAERRGKAPGYTAYPATWLTKQSWLSEPDEHVPEPDQPYRNPTDPHAYDGYEKGPKR